MTEKFTEAEFGPHVEPEMEHVRKLYADGVVNQFWSRPDLPAAVGIIEAQSLDDATSKMSTFPLFKAGMLEMTVVPLMPYRGFGPRNG